MSEPTMNKLMNSTWEKKREAFFATDPKCKECGRDLDHYSRTMLCRQCQKIIYKKRARAREPAQSRAYRKKHKEKIQAYQQRYYLINRETISMRKRIKYREKRRSHET